MREKRRKKKRRERGLNFEVESLLRNEIKEGVFWPLYSHDFHGFGFLLRMQEKVAAVIGCRPREQGKVPANHSLFQRERNLEGPNLQ